MMTTPPDTTKQKVQTIIVTCSVILMVGKFIAYFLTNSAGVLTDAMESIVNVTAGFISLYSIRQAMKPKDANHPFGHGKIELISASIEGTLIVIAGVIIVFEGVKRLFAPVEVHKIDIGIYVVAFAGLVNYLLGWYSIRQGRKHDSVALVAGGKHLQSDTYSTIGLVIGLLLLYVTKLGWIDSVLAIIFGGIIMVTGFLILRKTVRSLIDTADPAVLATTQKAILDHREDDWIEIHNLKAIKSGSDVFIDCDLTLPFYYNVDQGHDACERLRGALMQYFPVDSLISVHSDSCEQRYCRQCKVADCTYRREPFVRQADFSLAELVSPDPADN